MPVLLINGNLNQHTFANAVLAAHFDAQRRLGKSLDAVLIAHSRKSLEELSRLTEWRGVLDDSGLNPAIFTHIEVDLENDPAVIAELASHIERFISAVPPEDSIYVDLTNGQSLQKAALGAVAYILGAKDQFIIDVRRIGKAPAQAGFLSQADLLNAMVRTSDPIAFDSVALAWFTEVRRFRDLAGTSRAAVDRILNHQDPGSSGLWEAEMIQAVKMWLAGQKEHSGAQFGGAIRHTGLAFEELMNGLHHRLLSNRAVTPKTSRNLQGRIAEIGLEMADPELKKEVIDGLANALRIIRNASSHRLTASMGARRARIAIELLLSVVEYLDFSFGCGSSGSAQIDVIDGNSGAKYFFGLDGDDTGGELERMFRDDADAATLKDFSTRVDAATRQLAELVALPPIHGDVIFCAGDDILFSGLFDRRSLERFRKEYEDRTTMTCSLGFGKTLREAYFALKLAKSQTGKNSMMGVRITRI